MADIEKTTFEFPDEVEAKETEIEVVDDTPEKDKGRTLLREAPAEVTEDELSKYSDQKLKDRLAHLGKGYHEERRAKESATRERDEAFRMAQSVVEENKRLQGSLASNQSALLDQAKRVVASEIEDAKREYKQAYEAGDTDALVVAQGKLTQASIKADRVQNFKPAPVQEVKNIVQTTPQVQEVPQVDAKTRDWQSQKHGFATIAR